MRTRSSRAGITRRKNRDVIVIGEERISDGSLIEGAEARLDPDGNRPSDAHVPLGNDSRTPCAEVANGPAMPTADLVSLVTSQWMEAESKAQERVKGDRRAQEQGLEVAKATLTDAMEARHAVLEREVKVAIAKLEERAGEISQRERPEAGEYTEQLDERAAAFEQRLEQTCDRTAADLLKRHESLGEQLSDELSRSIRDFEARFDEWARDGEERLKAAVDGVDKLVPRDGVRSSASSSLETQRPAKDAFCRRTIVAGGLAVAAALGALTLNAGNPAEPAATPIAARPGEAREIHDSKPGKGLRKVAGPQGEPREDRAPAGSERSTAADSEFVATADVGDTAPPAPSFAPPPPAGPQLPVQPASEPESPPASEADVQQEFGP